MVLDQLVQRGGLQLVAPVGRGQAVGGRDRPAVLAVVPLVPPAVADRQVQPAVQRRLHPGGAARLQRPQRVVHPHVAALHHELPERHVVVRQEHDPVPDVLGVVGEPHDVLDQPLAALVGGVRLARDDDLHGPLGVQQERPEPVLVAQHQRQPLVGRDAAGEPDRQHVRVERRRRSRSLRLARAALPPDSRSRRRASVTSRCAASGASARSRRRRRRDAVPAVPGLQRPPAVPRAASSRTSRATQVPAWTPLVIEPIGTSAVSNPPHRPPNISRLTRAVQPADAVDALREAHPHHGHVEHGAVAAGVVLGAEREDALQRHLRGLVRAAEVPGDQLAGEPVDAGRDGRVRGEHGARPGRLQRLVEREAGVRHQLADALQAEEPGVPLVGVEDLGFGVPGDAAVGADGPHAADAEQHLLQQPVVAAAPVQPVGDVPRPAVVLLHVGVEQELRHPPDLRDPHLRAGGSAPSAGRS